VNESQTKSELIAPSLKVAGWGVVECSRIRREYRITAGRIEGHGKRSKADIADYVLEYRNTKWRWWRLDPLPSHPVPRDA
jgi:type I restriction enzyme R subunit